MSNSKEFYRPTPYNSTTKNQIWSTIFTDSHDLHCGCTEPAAHFLNTLIPPDHPARHQTIDNFINNCYRRQICLFGGAEETGGGEEKEEPTTKEEKQHGEEEKEDFTPINVEELLAAAAGAERR